MENLKTDHSSVSKMRIAVLLTCFNRRNMTMAALKSLFGQQNVEDLIVSVYLVDDGSRDGTSEAVEEEFPDVKLLRGDGSLFWNGGMRKAFAAAREDGHDAYIWFNDDTYLSDGALQRLVGNAVQASNSIGSSIIVGSVCDPVTHLHSYGGFARRAKGIRLDCVPVPPDETQWLRCDTMNGNFTLIPEDVAKRLGNLDGIFRQQLGDFDYGLRATREGIPIVIAPGYFGTCARNPATGTWRDTSKSFSQRWRHLMSPKGVPPREWLTYTKRHYRWRWPLYALSPYLKTILTVSLPGYRASDHRQRRSPRQRWAVSRR